MRIAGHALLVIGFLLCVSVAWAAIGFFAMGFGLILLLVVDERKKKSQLHLPDIETEPGRTPRQAALAPIFAAVEEIRRGAYPREHDEEWRSLIESDPDLARVATILTPYGEKYVDQLARAYVAFKQKAFLPIILNMVIASAREDASLVAETGTSAREASVSVDNQTELAELLRGAARGGTALMTARNSSFVQSAGDGAAIGLDQTASLTPAQRSGQISEGPLQSDGPTVEVFPAVQSPPAPDEYSIEVDHLRRLLDRLTLSPAKGQ